MKKFTSALFILVLLNVTAQDECINHVIVRLKNTRGGSYAGQTVVLTARSDGKKIEMRTNLKGEAEFVLPCNTVYDMTASNYAGKKEVATLSENNSGFIRAFSYEPNMIEKEKAMSMNEEEKKQIDAAVALTPDTVFLKGSVASGTPDKVNCSGMTFFLKDLHGKPLAGEQVKFVGKKRGKSVKGVTDANGSMSFYLPKGDEYSVNFQYSPDFLKTEVQYMKGNARSEMTISYLGTKEILKRKKEEEERIAAEEKRLKEEKEAFVKRCKTLKISEEEGHLREAMGTFYTTRNEEGKVVSAVLNRNNWSDKLIVCDLTGSMSPYASELAIWFKLNCTKEKNLQFVFFNDGDACPDSKKVIGATGGIYYSKASTFEELTKTMAKVTAAGSGGDCPENNMEALIKGTSMAAPYKELVMVVDNGAPVKDISLLNKFDKPVHIILCGSMEGEVLEDYMNIALKTKGTIHTIEEDIVKIAGMLEGQEIKIGKHNYKIMGGKFVDISKA